MEKEEIKRKLQEYTVKVVQYCQKLPNDKAIEIFSKHLINNAGMTGSKFMAAVNAKTPANFIQRARMAEEKASDCLYYLELIKAVYKESDGAEELIDEMRTLAKEIEDSYKSITNKKIGFGAYKEEDEV